VVSSLMGDAGAHRTNQWASRRDSSFRPRLTYPRAQRFGKREEAEASERGAMRRRAHAPTTGDLTRDEARQALEDLTAESDA
jgi:hypothetical protein